MRKICVVITARASYARVRTVLLSIQAHSELQLQLVVCASAVLERYGDIRGQLKEDHLDVDAQAYTIVEGETLVTSAKSVGLGLIELTTILDRLQPNAVVTIADRFETMATAVASSYMNLPLVHIQGGEVTGNIDEKVRHAITKLADIHLVATENARNRVIRMGEHPETVHITGCPSIDLAAEALASNRLNFDPIKKYGGVGPDLDLHDGYLVALHHPITTEYGQARFQVQEALYAVTNISSPVIWFWPNADAGSDGTSKGIRSFREQENPSNIHFFMNMTSMDFLQLLINSRGIVGNSSAGIRECSFLGVPAVNIGSRQTGRDRAENVTDVGYDRKEIAQAIHGMLAKPKPESSPLYGDGQAGLKIADLLASIPLTIEKRLAY